MKTYKTIEELPPYAQDEVKREQKRIEEGKKSKYDILRAINNIGFDVWIGIVVDREESITRIMSLLKRHLINGTIRKTEIISLMELMNKGE